MHNTVNNYESSSSYSADLKKFRAEFEEYQLSTENLIYPEDYWQQSIPILVGRTSTTIYTAEEMYQQYEKLYNSKKICRQIMETNACDSEHLKISLFGIDPTVNKRGGQSGNSIRVFLNTKDEFNSGTFIHELCHKALENIFDIYIAYEKDDSGKKSPYPELIPAYNNAIRLFLDNVVKQYLKTEPSEFLKNHSESLSSTILYGSAIWKNLDQGKELPKAIFKFFDLYRDNSHYAEKGNNCINKITELLEFIVRYPQAHANGTINEDATNKEILAPVKKFWKEYIAPALEKHKQKQYSMDLS